MSNEILSEVSVCAVYVENISSANQYAKRANSNLGHMMLNQGGREWGSGFAKVSCNLTFANLRFHSLVRPLP
jgi:hypothetical protein